MKPRILSLWFPLVAMALLPSASWAVNFKQVASLAQIIDLVRLRGEAAREMVVFLDLHDTLAVADAPEHLGTYDWSKEAVARGLSSEHTLEVWRRVHLACPLRPIEPTLADLMRELQELVPVLILTSASAQMAPRIYDQLLALGVDMKRNRGPFTAEAIVYLPGGGRSYLRNGIYAVDEPARKDSTRLTRKGQALRSLFTAGGMRFPKEIVVVDNSAAHLNSIYVAFRRSPTRFTLRYFTGGRSLYGAAIDWAASWNKLRELSPDCPAELLDLEHQPRRILE